MTQFGARTGFRAAAQLAGTGDTANFLRAGSSLVMLTSQLGLFGTALGIGLLALREVTAAQKEAADAAKLYISALSGTAGDTTADLQKKIAAEKAYQETLKGGLSGLQDLQKQFDTLRQGRDAALSSGAAPSDVMTQATAAFTELNAKVYDFTGGALGAKDGLGQWLTSTNDFNGEITQAQSDLDASTSKLGVFNAQMNSAATAANTAAAALKALSDAQVKAAQRDIEINNMTQGQRDDKAKQDMADFDALSKLILAGNLSAAAVSALEDQQTALLQDYKDVTAASSTYGDSLKAVTDQLAVISDSTVYHAQLEADARKATVDQETERIYALKEEAAAIATYLPELERLAPTSNEAAQALEAARTRLTRIGEDFQDIVTLLMPAAIARLNQKLLEDSSAVIDEANSAIFQAQSDEAAKIADLETAAGDKRTQIIQDAAAAIAKIERDAGREQKDDIRRRDVDAFLTSKQKAADALTDKQTAEDKDLALTTANLAKQEAATHKSEQAQLDSIHLGEVKKLDELNRASATQLSNLNAALTAQTVLHQQGGYQVESAINTHWSNVYTITTNWAHSISSAVAQALHVNLAPYTETPGGSGTPFNDLFDARFRQIYRGLTSGTGASAG